MYSGNRQIHGAELWRVPLPAVGQHATTHRPRIGRHQANWIAMNNKENIDDSLEISDIAIDDDDKLEEHIYDEIPSMSAEVKTKPGSMWLAKCVGGANDVDGGGRKRRCGRSSSPPDPKSSGVRIGCASGFMNLLSTATRRAASDDRRQRPPKNVEKSSTAAAVPAGRVHLETVGRCRGQEHRQQPQQQLQQHRPGRTVLNGLYYGRDLQGAHYDNVVDDDDDSALSLRPEDRYDDEDIRRLIFGRRRRQSVAELADKYRVVDDRSRDQRHHHLHHHRHRQPNSRSCCCCCRRSRCCNDSTVGFPSLSGATSRTLIYANAAVASSSSDEPYEFCWQCSSGSDRRQPPPSPQPTFPSLPPTTATRTAAASCRRRRNGTVDDVRGVDRFDRQSAADIDKQYIDHQHDYINYRLAVHCCRSRRTGTASVSCWPSSSDAAPESGLTAVLTRSPATRRSLASDYVESDNRPRIKFPPASAAVEQNIAVSSSPRPLGVENSFRSSRIHSTFSNASGPSVTTFHRPPSGRRQFFPDIDAERQPLYVNAVVSPVDEETVPDRRPRHCVDGSARRCSVAASLPSSNDVSFASFSSSSDDDEPTISASASASLCDFSVCPRRTDLLQTNDIDAFHPRVRHFDNDPLPSRFRLVQTLQHRSSTSTMESGSVVVTALAIIGRRFYESGHTAARDEDDDNEAELPRTCQRDIDMHSTDHGRLVVKDSEQNHRGGRRRIADDESPVVVAVDMKSAWTLNTLTGQTTGMFGRNKLRLQSSSSLEGRRRSDGCPSWLRQPMAVCCLRVDRSVCRRRAGGKTTQQLLAFVDRADQSVKVCTTRGRLVRTINFDHASNIVGLAATSRSEQTFQIYVVDAGNGCLYVHDVDTDVNSRIASRVPSSAASKRIRIGSSSCSSSSDSVSSSSINHVPDAAISTSHVLCQPYCIALSPLFGHVLVGDVGSEMVTAFDNENGDLARVRWRFSPFNCCRRASTINSTADIEKNDELGGVGGYSSRRFFPSSIAVDSRLGVAFVADLYNDAVYLVDAEDGLHIGTLTLSRQHVDVRTVSDTPAQDDDHVTSATSGPTALTVDPDRRLLYAAASGRAISVYEY